MTKQISASLVLMTVLTLTGCSSGNQFIRFPGVYKMDIQQGNLIIQKKVNQLKPSMSKEQIAYIMGQPILADAFNKNRWDYIDSFQPGGKKRQQKTLTLYFQQNKLISISGDLMPEHHQESL